MMKKRFLGRQWRYVQCTASMAALAVSATGCQTLLGIEDTTEVRADAAPGAPDAALPAKHTVRVTASGVLAPLSLELVHPGGSERLLVSGQGRAAQGSCYLDEVSSMLMVPPPVAAGSWYSALTT